jgi:AcrR family transcriptional regulator
MNNTREKIINAFFDLAAEKHDCSQFSMVELAEKVGLSRQSIQRYHFENKDSLLEAAYFHVSQEIKSCLKNQEPQKGISPFIIVTDHLFPLLYQQRTALKILFQSKMTPDWEDFLKTKHKLWLHPYVKSSDSTLQLSRGFMLDFVVNTMITIIGNWLMQENIDKPEIFKWKFLILMNRSTDWCIRKEYRLNI